PLDDPPRLGRRTGGSDPSHDPHCRSRRLAPADPRRGCTAGERAGRPQVARPGDACAGGRERAQRGPVARAAGGRGVRAGAISRGADRGRSRLMPLTVGTAGHIDHGKTWLVRALTGKDTDRLPEEQERGISIELGYAPLEVAGARPSLVDVP